MFNLILKRTILSKFHCVIWMVYQLTLCKRSIARINLVWERCKMYAISMHMTQSDAMMLPRMWSNIDWSILKEHNGAATSFCDIEITFRWIFLILCTNIEDLSATEAGHCILQHVLSGIFGWTYKHVTRWIKVWNDKAPNAIPRHHPVYCVSTSIIKVKSDYPAAMRDLW